MRPAVVHQPKEHQQPRPRALPLVDGVGKAGDVLAQLGEEPRERIRGLVDGVAAEEPAVFGVEHEHQPQEHREEAAVDLAGRLAEHVAQQQPARRVVGRLEAPQQVVQGPEHLLGQGGRDLVLVLARLLEDVGEALVGRQREEPLGPEEHHQGAEDGPARGFEHRCDGEGEVA